MLYLITGGSASGKSEYAEHVIVEYKKTIPKSDMYYIATMLPFGEETKKQIERHRNMRAGKGFETIECPRNLDEGLLQIWKNPGKKLALLECMSNLVANEMFCEEGHQPYISEKVMQAIRHLDQACECVVVVTNEVFSDSSTMTQELQAYVEELGTINCEIANIADRVIEVVYGIPVEVK